MRSCFVDLPCVIQNRKAAILGPMDSYLKFQTMQLVKLLLLGIVFFQCSLISAQNFINGDDVVCGGCHTYTYGDSSSVNSYGWDFFSQNGNLILKDSANILTICFDSLATGTYTLSVTTPGGQKVSMQIYFVPPQPIFLFSMGGSYCPNPNGNCEQVCAGTTVTYGAEVPQFVDLFYTVIGGTVLQQIGQEVVVLWDQPGQGSITGYSQDPCYLPTTFCIEVLPVPRALIGVEGVIAPDTIELCAGEEILLEDLSQPAGTTFWALADGRLSKEKNIRVSWDAQGEYDVALIVTTGCNCADTARLVVRVLSTSIPPLDCIGTVCPGERVTYTTVPGCSYQWLVSTEGTVISGGGPADDSISIQWNSGPQGTISLLATACGPVCPEAAIYAIPVLDGTAPIEGPGSVCKGTAATYSIIPYHGTEYTWTVSPSATILDGQGSNQITVLWPDNPIINSGLVEVVYTNCSQGCSGSALKNIVLTTPFHIEGPLQGCPDAPLLFKSRKGVLPISCSWKVLDANGNAVFNGVGMSDQFTYTAIHGSGNFTLVATQADPAQSCNEAYRWGFVIQAALPQPDSISGPAYICPGDTYAYVGHSAQTLYNLVWSIRNGPSQTQKTIDQTLVTWHAAGGPYRLELRHQLRQEPGCLSDPVFLDVFPVTGLSITGDPDVCLGETVQYSLNPVLTGLDVAWTLNPGTAGVFSANQQSGSAGVQWMGEGNALVQANVCAQSAQMAVTVHDLPQPSVLHAAGVCPGDQTPVTIASSYPGQGWYDLTGNLQSSGSSVNLGEGTWILGVEDLFGCRDTIGFTIDSYPIPQVSLSSPDPKGYCPSLGESPPTLYVVVDGPSVQIAWYFNNMLLGNTGPSMVASQFGSYHVVVTDQNGCTTASNPLTIFELCDPGLKCVGSFPVNKTPCPDLILQITPGAFCNQRTFTAMSAGAPLTNGFWKVDDFTLPGPVTFNQDVVSYTFPKAGYYPIYYGGTIGATFCDAALIDTIPVSADFDAETVCEGQNLAFKDRSTYLAGYTITQWDWDFGDPASGPDNVASIQHPGHIFSASGTFTVTLTITSSTGCISRISKVVSVRPKPLVNLTGPIQVCEDLITNWMGSSLEKIVDWMWDFGDPASGPSNSVAMAQASHLFATPGSPVVSLSVNDAFGCTNTITQAILVSPNNLSGTIQYSTPLCEGTSTTLHFNGAGDQFLWSTGSAGNDLVVTEAGAYELTVSNNLGCQFIPPLAVIEIIPEPAGLIRAIGKNEYGVTAAIHYQFYQACYGAPVILELELKGNYNVVWSTGSTGKLIEYSLDRNNPLPIGTHVFTASITDPVTGCTTMIGPMTVEVRPLPAMPNIAFNGSPPYCAFSGESITVQNIVGGLNYQWSTQQSGTTITVQTSGLYSVRAINQYGCATESNELALLESPSTLLAPDGCHRGCNPDTLCIGTPSWLASWQWYKDNVPVPPPSGNEALLPITQSGSYHLQLVHQNGCLADSDAAYMEVFDGISQFDGQVWFDVNNNGVIDGADTLVYGVDIQLINPSGGSLSVPSLPGLGYSFPDVPGLGSFTLSIDESTLPPGWTPVWQDSSLQVVSCDQRLTTDVLLQFQCLTVTNSVTLDVCPGGFVVYTGDTLVAGSITDYTLQTVQGCDSILTVSVAAWPDFNWQLALDSTCTGQTTGGVQFIPDPGNVGALEYSADGTSWSTVGDFTGLPAGMISFIVRDQHLCQKAVQFVIPEREALPASTWQIAVDTSCVGLANGRINVTSTGGSGGPVLYSLDGLNWQSEAEFTGLSNGAYTVYLQDNDACERMVQALVPAFPILDFTLPSIILSCDGAGIPIAPDFLSGQESVLSLSWEDGSADSIRVIDKPGTIALTVVGKCETVTRSQIVLNPAEAQKPDDFFFVPNGFSPDGNGINDEFRALPANGIEVLSYHFEVFDRWGNKLYETDNPNPGFGWNGFLRGRDMDQDVFVWWLEANVRFCRQEFLIKRYGDVTLVLEK
ncbi:MAG: PKD domain-containing protein [Saprospiraceae bacterium]|nr:PKD domain-containing protein [Saprospiraceae bacterium]